MWVSWRCCWCGCGAAHGTAARYGAKGQFRFLRSLAPWLVLLSVMLGNGGIFCWYSYVSPLMIHASGFTADDLTLIIMLAGSACSRQYHRRPFSDRLRLKVVRFTLATAAATPRDLLRGARPLPLRRPDGALHGMSVLLMPQQLLILENSRGGEMLGAALVQVAFNLAMRWAPTAAACRSTTGWVSLYGSRGIQDSSCSVC